MNAITLRLFLTTVLLLTGSLVFGQTYADNFEDYSNRDQSFKYGYTYSATSVASGTGSITNRGVRTSALSNPLANTHMTTGWLNLNAGSTISFQTRVTNTSSSAVLTVSLLDVTSASITLGSDAVYTYVGTTTVNRTVSLGASRTGWYKVRFFWAGTGGSAQAWLDNITSNVPAVAATGRSTRLADLQITGAADKATYKVGDDIFYTLSLRNNGPDPTDGATIRMLMPASMNLEQITFSGVSGTYDAAAKKFTINTMGSTHTGTITMVSRVMEAGTYSFGGNFEAYNFMTDPTASNHMGSITITSEEATLPVVFASFTGKATEEGTELVWKTAMEKNAAAFHILYSTNGQDFEQVGTVSASGNSMRMLTYTFTHNTSAAQGYYQIKQVDFDGTVTMSPRIAVGTKTTAEAAIKAYPNPAAGMVTVSLSTEDVPVLINMAGVAQEVSFIALGNGTWQADLSQLAAGAYMLTTNTGAKPVRLIKA